MTSIDAPHTSTRSEDTGIRQAMPWLPLTALSVGAFWTVTLEMLPAGLLLPMSDDLDVRPSRIGLLVTAWALTVGLTSLPLTRLTARWRRTSVLALGIGGLGIATLATAVAPSFETVLVARLLAAAGHGLFWSVLMVYAASIAPPGRQARAISVVLAGPVLAGVAGLPVATALADLAGWRVVTGVIALGALLGGALIAGRARPAPAAPDGATPAGGGDARAVHGMALGGALALVAHFATFTYVAELVHRQWALGGIGLETVLLVFGVAGAVGLGLVALWGDRSPRRLLLSIVGGLAAILGLLGVIGSERPGLAVVVIALWGLITGAVPPALQNVILGAAPPSYRDRAGAINVTAFNLGIATGSAAGAVVLDHLSLPLLPVLAAVVAVISFATLLLAMARAEG